ncbi:MAG: hypothetical protein ACTSYA_01740 [Candidatus Kariarchaeaceae archaeon]
MITQREIFEVTKVPPTIIRERIKEWQENELLPEGKNLNYEKNREKFIQDFLTGGYRR